mgnify:CR=1 FL=1
MAQTVTILLVEDDDSMRHGIHELLEGSDLGYEITVVAAGDGEEGLTAIQQVIPDVIISDVMMPNMNGYQFLEEVRANPQWEHVPFIFVTAKGEREDRRKGKLSDADLYITKPFVISQLLELVQTQLDRAVQKRTYQNELTTALNKNLLQILNHEFRTPLTYVTAYYEMLSSSVAQIQSGQDLNEYLRGIRAGNIRLTRLVEDFILVMSLRSGEAAELFAREAGIVDNLAELIDAAVIVKQWDAQHWDVAVQNEITGSLPPVWGDVAGLQSILKRLLDNAIKFTGAKFKRIEGSGAVRITAVSDENELRISIADQGMGIPEKALQNIFELFEQHDRDVMEQQGTGMGLVIVDGLVSLHNGRIDIESVVGEGCIFTIILPIYKPDKHGQPATLSPQKRTARILIVEDDEFLREGLADLLGLHDERYELQIETAVHGEDGLVALQKSIPDLIISDIMMPKMDGYAFLKNVRQNPNWFQIPFIFLTAKGEKQDEFEGFRLGVDEYITKPYDSDDMILFVTKRLDRHFVTKQKQVQSFNDLKRNIINLITPEFLVPLDTVSESSARLALSLERADNETAMQQSLAGIYKGSLRLTALIEDVIALAELQTGESQTVYKMRAYAVPNIELALQDHLQRVANGLMKDGWQLNYEPYVDNLSIFADTILLFNMVERLIKIGVATLPSQADKEILVTLEPTIPPQFFMKICFADSLSEKNFESFHSILSSNELGNLSELPSYAPSLYVSQGYAQLHNGRIQLNQTVEEPLTFTITLPSHEGT